MLQCFFLLQNIIVDVPLWIETEGAVQHVKDYIVHYKLTPPSATGLLTSEDEEDNEEDDDVKDSMEENNQIGDKRKIRKDREDEEEDEEEEEEEEEEEDSNGDGDGKDVGDGAHDMYLGMYETAIEMAADDDNKS